MKKKELIKLQEDVRNLKIIVKSLCKHDTYYLTFEHSSCGYRTWVVHCCVCDSTLSYIELPEKYHAAAKALITRKSWLSSDVVTPE